MISDSVKNPLWFIFLRLLTHAIGDNERCPFAATNYSIFNVDLIRSCNRNFLQFQFKISDDAFSAQKHTIVVDTVDFDCLPGYAQRADFTETVDFNSSTTKVLIPYDTSSEFKLFRNCSYNLCINDRKWRSLYGLQRHLPDFYFHLPVRKECDPEACLCDTNEVSIVKTNEGYEIVQSWNDVGSYELLNITYLYDCGNDYAYQQVKPTIINSSIVKYSLEHYNGDNACLTVVFRKRCGCYIFKSIRVNETNSDQFPTFVIASKPSPNYTYPVVGDTRLNYDSIVKKGAIILGIVLVVSAFLYPFSKKFKSYLRGYGINIATIENCPRTSMRKGEIATLLNLDSKLNNADPYELPRSNVELSNEIGKGAFGQVYLAKALINGVRMHVAVKTLKDKAPAEELDDFLEEIDVLKKVGKHCNIVKMYKCCTATQPYMMVMEYIPFGDLKNYLWDLRGEWNKDRNNSVDSCFSDDYIMPESPKKESSLTEIAENEKMGVEYVSITTEELMTENLQHVLDHRELQNFALQIAKGMAHLERLSIIHRDLAARNILINERKVLKISDFGLSRRGPYMTSNLKKLPLRWMAIESIEDHIYDSKSDVWSFAVVLWEIGTLGGFPYEQIADNMLVYHIQNGKRLQRPAICTDAMYDLMLRCWSKEPHLRPTFKELTGLLDNKTRSIYIDFSQLNPSYVFPPVEYETKPVSC